MIKQFAAVVLLFVFCAGSFAAEDPLAYIPDAKGYLGVNFDKAKASPVLMEAVKTVMATLPSRDEAPDVPGSVKRVYFSAPDSLMKLDPAKGYFTVTGLPGMVDDFLVAANKPETLTSDTVNAGALGVRQGFTLKSGGFVYPIENSGVVITQKENLPGLISNAATGRTSASNGGFQFVHNALNAHAIAAATAVDDLMVQLTPTLMKVPGMPINLDDATSSILMASMWLDLVSDLDAEVNLHVANSQHSQVLINAINHFLDLLKQSLTTSGHDPDMLQVVKGIKCGSSIYGVTIKVHIPNPVVLRLGLRAHELKLAKDAARKGALPSPTPRVTGLTPTPVPTKIPPRR